MTNFGPDLPDSFDHVPSDDGLRQRLRRSSSRAHAAIWAAALAGIAGALASLAWLGPHGFDVPNSAEQHSTAQAEPIAPMHVAQAQDAQSAPPSEGSAGVKAIEMPT